jgi:hypothetical protein
LGAKLALSRGFKRHEVTEPVQPCKDNTSTKVALPVHVANIFASLLLVDGYVEAEQAMQQLHVIRMEKNTTKKNGARGSVFS